MTIRSSLVGGLLLTLLSSTAFAAPATERFNYVSNGEIVGSLSATTDQNRVTVDYRVDNNGRGPKHQEQIALDANGIPLSWTVKGTSTMGGAVDEWYRWQAGRAEWKSQADQGSLKAPKPPLYVLNDDSPWALWIYARAALAQPDATIRIAPSGTLKVEKLREMTVGEGDRAETVSVYSLTGIFREPRYILLDRDRRLFATFDSGELSGAIVRAGYEKLAPDLLQKIADVQLDRARDLQRRLGHRLDVPVRIRNVRVFDPESGKLSPLSTVIIYQDRITAVLPEDKAPTPDDEASVDGEGGTVYPGLHDMHSHATLDAGLFYLAAGVTATRDMGNSNAFMQKLLPLIDAGEIAWPRIVPDGFIEGRSPYSARYGFVVDTLGDALKAVRWYADRGYFEIKLYNSFNPDWVAPVAEEAHRLGMNVTGHVPAFDTPDRAIEDGYTAIAHINQLMLGWVLKPGEDTRTPLRVTAMARAGALDLSAPNVQKTVSLMKEHGVALDTTSSVIEQLILSRGGETPEAQKDFLDHMPIGFQRYRKRSYVPITSPQEDKAYRDGFAKVIDVMAMLHRNGILMLPGTDDETGFSVLRELELYVKAGFTPAEALRAGTLDMERYFGRTDLLGKIERGKLADFVLVPGDPTRNISAIRRPRMVVKGGTIYFPTEIYQAIGVTPFTTSPAIQMPKAPPPADRDGMSVGFGYGDEGNHLGE